MFRAPTVDHALVRELKDAEDARFHAERPRSAELWARAWKVMPNGVPMSWHRGSASRAERDQFMISRLRTSAQRVNTPW